MSNQRNAIRRPFTDEERAVYAALAVLAWRPGSMDGEFVAGLARYRALSERQSRRLYRIAAKHLDALDDDIGQAVRAKLRPAPAEPAQRTA